MRPVRCCLRFHLSRGYGAVANTYRTPKLVVSRGISICSCCVKGSDRIAQVNIGYGETVASQINARTTDKAVKLTLAGLEC